MNTGEHRGHLLYCGLLRNVVFLLISHVPFHLFSFLNDRYSILGLTAALMLMSFVVMGSRPFSEGFASFWSAAMLCVLSIGGTMIMRKFHNSMAVGFFMGSVVAMSQMFFLLFLL